MCVKGVHLNAGDCQGQGTSSGTAATETAGNLHRLSSMRQELTMNIGLTVYLCTGAVQQEGDW